VNPRSPKRKPLRARLRAAATDAILDAAEEVAAERGLEGATCAAIAERAGVAVGTLYNYFPDRDGMLAALFAARRSELGPQIAAAAERSAHLPFAARLRGFIHDVMAAYEAERTFIVLALEADRAMPKVKDPRGSLMNQFTAALEQVLADGARMGVIPAGHHAEYARMLQGQLKALVVWRIADGEPLTRDVDLVVDTFLRGALVP
jgi:AcrR family transcriptional regulator